MAAVRAGRAKARARPRRARAQLVGEQGAGPRGARRDNRRADRGDARGRADRDDRAARPRPACSFAGAPGRVKKRKAPRGAGPVQVDEGWDPILPPDVLGRPMQVSLDGVTYQLVKATYQQGSGELSLVFEHELVYLLKRHKGGKRARREKVTRAQFILALVKELEPEVRRRRYRFVCPELNVRQKIDGGRKQTGTVVTGATSGDTRTSGGGATSTAYSPPTNRRARVQAHARRGQGVRRRRRFLGPRAHGDGADIARRVGPLPRPPEHGRRRRDRAMADDALLLLLGGARNWGAAAINT